MKSVLSNHSSKKLAFMVLSIFIIQLATAPNVFATIPGEINQDSLEINYRNITIYAPAVGQTSSGYIGVLSTITLTIQSNGSGRVFVDTLPLAQIDMQGSARLAVKVATSLVKNDQSCEINPSDYDYFFVIRTESPIIGGPSAGGIMTAAVISLLEEWNMDEKTVMTGMINPDGSIGPIGGITQKIDAAYSVGATRFLIPEGQMTYTDTVIDTISNNGWIQTTTKTVTRNVSDYGWDNYGIEVIEVSDIKEVIEYYTGYRFPSLKTNDSISTEDYIDSMKPLATSLLSQANESFQNASNLFYAANIPNSFPYYYRNSITDYLNNAKQTLTESEDWYNQQLYYTSTSKSFQSLINSRFVTYACEYFSSSDTSEYVSQLIEELESYYKNQSQDAKNTEVNGMITLQCVGAAQKRASEAGLYIDLAKSNYQSGDGYAALYHIAFAYQRAESIEWWLGLSKYFNDTGSISSIQLDELANEYIQDAQQSIIYSQVILEEIGGATTLLSEAEAMLDSAHSDIENGYPAAALFEALEALSKGNLALELVDATTTEKIQSKLDRANESAIASISESRLRGIEPLLAVSYYEFAQSMIEENVENALFYYKYSDLIPGVLSFTGECETQSSRYVGIPEPTLSFIQFNINRYGEYFIIFTFIGILGGIGIGIFIGKSFQKKEKSNRSADWSPFSIHDYREPKRSLETTSDQFPTSINDYYKKSK